MLAPIPPRRAARCARRRAPGRGGHLPHENQGTQSRDQELHRRSSGRRRSPDLALRRLRRGHVDRGRLLPRSRACCRGCLRSAVRTKGTPGIRGSAQATHCCALSVCALEETAHHVCLLLDGLQRALQGALLELSDGTGVNSEPRCQRQLRGCVLLGEDIPTHLLDSSNRA